MTNIMSYLSGYLVNCDKPSIKIYEIMLERLKQIDTSIQPSNVLFIDDKLRNLKTAQGTHKSYHQ